MSEKLREGLGWKEILGKGLQLLARPRPEKVVWLNFAVTYLCNSRCITCDIWKRYQKNPELLPQELTPEEIEVAFTSSKYLRHLQGVGLTGGEPFLRKDFVELAGFFIKRYPEALISVASNGLQTELIAGKVQEIVARYNPRFFGLSLSLDGIDETHNEVRGMKDAYTRVMKTFAALAGNNRVQIALDFTITPQNYQDILEVFEFSKRNGIKFLANFAQNSDIFYGNKEVTFNWGTNDWGRLEAVMDKLIKAKIGNESPILKIVDPNAYFIAGGVDYAKYRQRIFKCYAGTHSFFLDPYGNVYPCIMLGEKLGNIKDTELDALWLSLEAAQIREYINQEKCHCWVACEVVPSLLRSPAVVGWNLRNKFLKRG